MELLQYLGHYHPLILHLPIGFLLLGFIMQLFDWIGKSIRYAPAIHLALFLGMLSALGATVTGYWLSLAGGYEEQLLERHQWLGIGVSGLSVLTWLTFRWKKEWYAPSFVLLVLTLMAAGHYGGSLTHGVNFLHYQKAAPVVKASNLETAVLFTDIIQPILKDKCVRCHNTSKTKGDLLMSTVAGLQKGGETGALFIAGDTINSLFLKRIHLPLAAEKHMPPEGKKQLTADEITLLNWWIKEGADFEKKLTAFTVPANIQPILTKYLPATDGLPTADITPVDKATIANLRQKGIPIALVHENSPFVEVDLSRKSKIEKYLPALKAVKKQIISLNLAYSDVSDKGLDRLASFPHLQKLYLQKTAITNQSLAALQDLDYLEYLNLYGTRVDDEGLEKIKDLPRLKKLYLWQSGATQEGIARLVSDRPKLDVQAGINRKLFGEARLKPPIIESEKDLFQDSLQISLEMNFKNITIYYTTDGTIPDTTSQIYSAPITIFKTSKINTIAHKQGWKMSNVAERQFVQAKYTPIKARLDKAPNDRYKANSANSLIDFQKGTIIFTDGNWLGYEKEHFTATLDLGSIQTINGVTVSALEATGSYIFFPKGMKVSVSKDNATYETILTKKYQTTQAPVPPRLKNFTEKFSSPQMARFVRVKVESNLVNPKWHPAPGAPCWVFVDEILVE